MKDFKLESNREKEQDLEFVHKSVLVNEIIEIAKTVFSLVENPVMIDCTLGLGGHSLAFLKAFSNLEVFGIDKDLSVWPIAKKRLSKYLGRFFFVHTDFSNLEIIDKNADFILMDLGVSSMQIDNAQRGFSYMENANLDMRMDLSQNINAAEIVNEYSYDNLKSIFLLNGERNASRVAKNIVKYREISPIKTTQQLVKIADISIPRNYRSGHRAKKIFQALRIAVNNELDSLKKGLVQASQMLNEGGILAVIDYHSLEGKIVKHFFRKLSSPSVELNLPELPSNSFPKFELLPKISPSEKEISDNSRSASAHLRCIKKIVIKEN